MDLPVKLMITMIIITAFIPVLSDALNDNQERIADAEMQQEAGRLKNAISMVSYSGIGSCRTLELNVPAGCELWVGGEGSDAFCIRSVYDGRVLSKEYLERPSVRIPEEMCITGNVTLKIASIDCGGVQGAEVTAL